MGKIEKHTCHRCRMSFRLGKPAIPGSKHEAHTCSDCKLMFHCTGTKQTGRYVAVPYITQQDANINARNGV